MGETTSRHLRNASEVLLWIPIKNEFAQFDEQIVSYASRLSAFLNMVFQLRRESTERRALDSAGPVERLQVVYNVQWTVLEEERRLLVAASFDRSWETYFRELADTTGALLDAIFCHCEGYQGNTCADGFDSFMAWIRDFQRPCDFFFSAAPDLTTDDFRYLKELSRVADPDVMPGVAAARASRISVEPPAKTAPHAEPKNIESALWGLYELRKLFPARAKLGKRDKDRNERAVFDGAVSALFFNEEAGLQLANRELARRLEAAKVSMQSPARPSLAARAAAKDLQDLLLWSRGLASREIERKRNLVAPVEKNDVQVLSNNQLASIQGGILSDYPSTTHGVMALVQCDTRESFGAFLKDVHDQIASELDRVQHDRAKSRLWMNVGLTYRGLERLGLPESALLQFPKEFREGMEARAGLLGDIGDPDYPLETGPVAKGAAAGPRVRMSAVDAVVLIQSQCKDLASDDLRWWTGTSNPFRAALDALAKKRGVRVLSEQPLQRQFTGGAVREHFGFVEGEARGSQPVPRVAYEGHPGRGPAFSDAAPRDGVRLGEVLLGYENQRGEDPRKVELDGNQLLLDGSFLVVRKLQQDVGAFRDFVATGAKRLEIKDDQFKSLIVGRAPSDGAPLIPAAASDPNDFHFDADAEGERCPHFAHIRRTNPRTRGEATVVPRILRRGFSYGPSCPERTEATAPRDEESADRGLVFMAYNANIAEQFEVIQRWINGGNRTGLLSTQQDLLAGQGPISQAAYWHRSDDSSRDKQFGPPARPLVKLHWGAYLFVPSKITLQALQELAADPDIRVDPSAAERGEVTIQRLLALECVQPQSEVARAAWKKVLEEPISATDAADVWQAVRSKHDGVLRTAHGVLVANLDLAVRVLRDDGATYSVSKYGERLGQLIGPHFLGLDRADPEYARLAKDPNEFAYTQIWPEDAFNLARKFAIHALHEALPGQAWQETARQETARQETARQETYLRRLAEIVVLQLCHAWFELPLEPERLNALVFTSRYAFQVSPGKWVEDEVPKHHGFIAAPRPAAGVADDASAFRKYVRTHERTHEHEIDLALNGAIVGFAAPAIASIVSILDAWSADGELWRLAAIARSANLTTLAAANASLLKPVLKALQRKPVPSLLYRTARKSSLPLPGQRRREIEDGDTIIVGLGAVYEDAREKGIAEPEQWLFGGNYTDQSIQGPVTDPARVRNAGTSHGCPARNAALAVLVGAVSAVLSVPNLQLERRFVVSYSPFELEPAAEGSTVSVD
jgi:Dyp-type peroxidase family